jgi:hypothetical protein
LTNGDMQDEIEFVNIANPLTDPVVAYLRKAQEEGKLNVNAGEKIYSVFALLKMAEGQGRMCKHAYDGLLAEAAKPKETPAAPKKTGKRTAMQRRIARAVGEKTLRLEPQRTATFQKPTTSSNGDGRVRFGSAEIIEPDHGCSHSIIFVISQLGIARESELAGKIARGVVECDAVALRKCMQEYLALAGIAEALVLAGMSKDARQAVESGNIRTFATVIKTANGRLSDSARREAEKFPADMRFIWRNRFGSRSGLCSNATALQELQKQAAHLRLVRRF